MAEESWLMKSKNYYREGKTINVKLTKALNEL